MKLSTIKKQKILILLTIAFILRIVFFAAASPWNNTVSEKRIVRSDAIGYQAIAVNTLQTGKFSIDGIHPDSFRTPGYPYFIAFVYFIVGIKPWIVLLVQILISVASVLLLYKITGLLFQNNTIAFIAAAILAIDPHVIQYTCELFTETLFIFSLLLFLYFLLSGLKNNKLLSFVFAGAMLGFTVLVRPIALYLPLLIITIVFFNKGFILKQKIKISAIIIISYLFIITPWMYRNYVRFNHFKIASTQEYNMLFYNVVYSEVNRTGKTVDELCREYSEKSVATGAKYTHYTDVDARNFYNGDIYKKISGTYLKEHLGSYLYNHTKNCIFVYLNVGTKGFLSLLGYPEVELAAEKIASPNLFVLIKEIIKTKPLIEIVLIVLISLYFMIIYSLALVGVSRLIKEKQYFPLIFLVFLLTYFTYILGSQGNVARFKLPLIPIYSILTAVGFFSVLERFHIKNKPIITIDKF
jgi:4-amino-4-deoxy-L-arabinose transferase-like glycosyltransferase